MEMFEVDVLQPESDQDVMKSLQPIRVSLLQDRVNKNFDMEALLSHSISYARECRRQDKTCFVW